MVYLNDDDICGVTLISSDNKSYICTFLGISKLVNNRRIFDVQKVGFNLEESVLRSVDRKKFSNMVSALLFKTQQILEEEYQIDFRFVIDNLPILSLMTLRKYDGDVNFEVVHSMPFTVDDLVDLDENGFDDLLNLLFKK